jgi:integrase
MAARIRIAYVSDTILNRTCDGKTRPYGVRWRVGTRQFEKWFTHKATAQEWRGTLQAAVKEGQKLDPVTGLPASQNADDISVAQWVFNWYREQWVTWGAGSRRDAYESIMRWLPVLSSKTTSAPATLSKEIRVWLEGPGQMPAYLIRTSPMIADITEVQWLAAWNSLATGMRGGTNSANTTVRFRKTLKATLAAAVATKLIDPVVWPKTPRRQKTRSTHRVNPSHVAGVTQFEALLPHLAPIRTGNDYRLLFALSFYAGLRPGEAFALEAEDIDRSMDQWFIVVSRTARVDLDWLDGDAVLAPVKAGGVGRRVAISNRLREIIELVEIPASGPLFSIERSAAYAAFSRAKKMAAWAGSIGDSIPYDLRHSCATLWLRSGMPIRTAATQLGHAPEELVRTYDGFLQDDLDIALARVNSYITAALTKC